MDPPPNTLNWATFWTQTDQPAVQLGGSGHQPALGTPTGPRDHTELLLEVTMLNLTAEVSSSITDPSPKRMRTWLNVARHPCAPPLQRRPTPALMDGSPKDHQLPASFQAPHVTTALQLNGDVRTPLIAAEGESTITCMETCTQITCQRGTLAQRLPVSVLKPHSYFDHG